MMDIAELKELIAILEGSGMELIEIVDAGKSLRLVMETEAEGDDVSADVHEPSEAPDPVTVIVTAHLAGAFLVQHPLRSARFAPIGDRIRAGEILGLVQVGTIYSPVTAPSAGSVRQVLAEPEMLVGFGTPLFEFAPTS